MYYLKLIIDACSSILNYRLSACGYEFTLMQFLVFSCLVIVAFKIVKALT